MTSPLDCLRPCHVVMNVRMKGFAANLLKLQMLLVSVHSRFFEICFWGKGSVETNSLKGLGDEVQFKGNAVFHCA